MRFNPARLALPELMAHHARKVSVMGPRLSSRKARSAL
jgi:hypothetical protein